MEDTSSKSVVDKMKGIISNMSDSLTNSENSQLIQVVFAVIIFLEYALLIFLWVWTHPCFVCD